MKNSLQYYLEIITDGKTSYNYFSSHYSLIAYYELCLKQFPANTKYRLKVYDYKTSKESVISL